MQLDCINAKLFIRELPIYTITNTVKLIHSLHSSLVPNHTKGMSLN